ncbi:MAG: hypothetical protein K2X27_02860 [Candidatus Obscuribacterales bacterium]|nr:hypothetical protein [Candidatus Obscuribacterales bacterium]
MSARSFSSRKGQSIIETVVGIIFLVPIVLFLFDVAVLVLCNTANDNLAKSCCRAAASAVDTATNTGTADKAYDAANAIADSFAVSSIIEKPGASFLTGFSYNDGTVTPKGTPPDPPAATGQVICVTTMRVKVPVPFPFIPSQVDFQAKDVEPIVSIAP